MGLERASPVTHGKAEDCPVHMVNAQGSTVCASAGKGLSLPSSASAQVLPKIRNAFLVECFKCPRGISLLKKQQCNIPHKTLKI